MNTLALLALLAAPTLAQAPEEAAPEFLLGDVGVRIDLPPSWRDDVIWSDWDFECKNKQLGVMLYAWYTPGQVPITAEELPQWGELYAEKADFRLLEDVVVAEQEVRDSPHGPIGWSRLGFKLPSGVAGHMHAVSLPVEAKVFHMVTFTPRSASRSERGLQEIVDRLDIHTPAAELGWAAEVEAEGIQTTLTDHWRPPLDAEMPLLKKPLEDLGIDSLKSCWLAFHPYPVGDPEVLATCQGGMWLGIVDSYTFEDKEKQVRARLFGSAPMDPATPIELADRTGFLYTSDVGEQVLVMGVVPYDQGLSRTWVLGPEDRSEALEQELRAVLSNTTFSGPHPTSFGDWLAYYPTYRPTHPFVLVPAGLLVLLVGGIALVVIARGRRNPYEDFE